MESILKNLKVSKNYCYEIKSIDSWKNCIKALNYLLNYNIAMLYDDQH